MHVIVRWSYDDVHRRMIATALSIVIIQLSTSVEVDTMVYQPEEDDISRAFIFCWSPYFVYDLLDVYGHIPRTNEMIAVSTFIQSLAPLNSAANPIIYMLFNSRMYKKFFKNKGHNSSPINTTRSHL